MAVCTTDSRKLLAYRSDDGGATWRQSVISATEGADDFTDHGGNIIFPSIAEGRDGSLYFLYHQQKAITPGSGAQASTRLLLFSSKDNGATWAERDVTPEPGIWANSGIAAAPNGSLGISGYYRRNVNSPWQYRATVFNPVDKTLRSYPVQARSVLPASITSPPGEFTQAAFDANNKLHVVYDQYENSPASPVFDAGDKQTTQDRVMYAQQR